MKPSILRNLLLSFLLFGLAMGLVFPLYAQFFVEWKPGMKLWFSIGCVLAGLTIGIANYLLCKQVLLKRLQQISVIAGAISNNDISAECKLRSDDLIGKIGDAFNQMTRNLRNMIGRIQRAVNELNGEIGQLVSIAEKSREGAQTQLEETTHVADILERLSINMQQVSELAQQTATSIEQADQQARNGALIATEAIGSISALGSRMDRSAKVIQRVEEKSESIGVVMDVIRGIAEQTNLLALNAAIEAARAGEHGRGFAVVADEVRTLATRTQESTHEIEQIIGQLQAGSQDAVSVMNEAQSSAESTESHFEQAAELLAEISGETRAVVEISRQMAEAASSQNAAVIEVSQRVTTIGEVCRQSSEGASQAARSSSVLMEESRALKELVEQFQA